MMASNTSVQNTHVPGVYNPPLNAHYTQISTEPVSEDAMRISIGQNGKVFKAITHQAKVNYIWFNKEKKYVEIWGPEQNLQDACNRVVTRIQTIISKLESGEIKLKEGGSFHTDSPQWSKVPDFIGLLCIRPAKVGGISKFVSAYTIHNQFSKTNPNFLNFVYDNFHFDKRGEFKENESPTTFEPIFKYHDKQLMFRYLRNYIDAGQKIAEKPLTNEQNNILDELDKIIHNEKFSVSYDLKKFDMTFFNNHRIIHGRTSFEDFSDTEKKRFMIRSWIKDNS